METTEESSGRTNYEGETVGLGRILGRRVSIRGEG